MLALTLAALALLAAQTRTAPGRTLVDDLAIKAAALSPRHLILLTIALGVGFGFALLGVAEMSLVISLDMTMGMEAAVAIGWAASVVRVKWFAARVKAVVLGVVRRPPSAPRDRAVNDNAPRVRTEASDGEEEEWVRAA
jgi:hypothetical protein